MEYGIYFSKANGQLGYKKTHSYKKSRFGWLVFELHTEQLVMTVPTRLRAQYVCARLNGVDVSKVFYFGDL